MELGVCIWGTAATCPNLHSRNDGIFSRDWNAGQRCRLSHHNLPRGRRELVVTNASKSRFWEAEPLVKGSVTRRAMHIVKTLRSSDSPEIAAALQNWVMSMQPTRKDWLTVLKEFDNKLERTLYFKVQQTF